ncbi:PREDICTED: uncharacterized protein LOC101303535 [Fragaria vesca subsp. vesca]|uniref:uncharacterized protein LOC101303535 n=1 Tax=Fragaria vesca subsp. vesca TaxID=101020 RepID=UPI0002C36A18|nr:PREDICTED: uncharacterized protein LOC101303535 [Fragaria vesca subsp. vesca]
MGKYESSRVGQGELYSPAHATKVNISNKEKQDSSMDVGQGELYSPAHAIKVSSNEENQPKTTSNAAVGVVEATKEVAMDVKRNLGAVKDMILEKLGAHAPAVPADALDNVGHFLESVVKDVTDTTGAEHGVTMEVLHRIKTQLGDMLPNLSPDATKKMVDEVQKELSATNEEGGRCKAERNQEQGHLKQSSRL